MKLGHIITLDKEQMIINTPAGLYRVNICRDWSQFSSTDKKLCKRLANPIDVGECLHLKTHAPSDGVIQFVPNYFSK
jgi:hypothetical protein